MGAWILKKSDSPIGESESKGHAIPWLSMIFIADCFDFAHFAVNCMEPAYRFRNIRVTNAVHPVWWEAPKPRPWSPWKYSWNRTRSFQAGSD